MADRPTLADLAANPALTAEVDLDRVPELLGEMERLRAILWAYLRSTLRLRERGVGWCASILLARRARVGEGGGGGEEGGKRMTGSTDQSSDPKALADNYKASVRRVEDFLGQKCQLQEEARRRFGTTPFPALTPTSMMSPDPSISEEIAAGLMEAFEAGRIVTFQHWNHPLHTENSIVWASEVVIIERCASGLRSMHVVESRNHFASEAEARAWNIELVRRYLAGALPR